MESAGESSHSADTGTTLLQSILSTIEFYFSDINLSRNKFLAHKVLENPCKYFHFTCITPLHILKFFSSDVPVSLLLTFHKLQELTTNESLVIEAIKMSKMLHLSEDGTKVFRTTEIRPVDTIDEHLIYVVNNFLPNN
jgi:La domain